MRIRGVTADTDQQRHVIDDRTLLVIEPEPLAQSQRDQTLAQNVLHRLAEPQVNAERECTDKLGKTNMLTTQLSAHRAESNPRSDT